MHEIIYGIGSVNVFVNHLSHMARSSIETVYEYSKRKNYKPDFLLLKWLSNQSGILEELIFLSATIIIAIKSREKKYQAIQ